MSRDAIKNWLSDVLVASGTVASGSFPRPAYEGVLFNNGYAVGSEATIYKDRPARNLDSKTRLVVIINMPDGSETTRTSGGVYAQRERSVNIELDILWVADFSGNQLTGTPPTYTSEDVSGRKFDGLVDSVMLTLALSFFEEKSAGEYVGRGWPLTDQTTGFKSILKAMMPDFEHIVNSPELAENQTDLFYAAMIRFQLTEMYNSLGT